MSRLIQACWTALATTLVRDMIEHTSPHETPLPPRPDRQRRLSKLQTADVLVEGAKIIGVAPEIKE
jgi:hypothetical protein